MMNVLALSLVLATMVTAGVWSPAPHPPAAVVDQKTTTQDVIIKDGHRVVVVEYEKDNDQGNTKVSISPQDSSSNNVDDAGAGEDMVGGGGSSSQDEYHHQPAEAEAPTTKDLVCDAFGKCKRRIARAFERTKDAAAEKSDEAVERAGEAEEGTGHRVGEVLGKARDAAAEKAYNAGEGMERAKEVAAEKAREAAGKAYNIGEGLGKARKAVGEKTRVAAEKAYEVEEGTRHTLGDKLGKARERVEEMAGKAREAAAENARVAAEKAYEMEEGTRHTLGEIAGKARDGAAEMAGKAKDAVADKGYQAAEEMKDIKREVSEKLEEAKDTLKDKIVNSAEKALVMANLIGLATAYGMCVWVTFVSSYVLARALPRQQFAILQSKIYPIYFKGMAYSIGTALLGHLLSQSQRANEFMGLSLLFPLITVLVNLVYFEPRATKVMFERMKMEKEEGRGKESVHVVGESGSNPTGVSKTTTKITKQQEKGEGEMSHATKLEMIKLGRRLKKLNSYSSCLNIATLMSLTLSLASLAHCLHKATC